MTNFLKQNNQVQNNENITITPEQLNFLIEKIKNKISRTLDKEGRSLKTLDLSNSIGDTIETYLKKGKDLK